MNEQKAMTREKNREGVRDGHTLQRRPQQQSLEVGIFGSCRRRPAEKRKKRSEIILNRRERMDGRKKREGGRVLKETGNSNLKVGKAFLGGVRGGGRKKSDLRIKL